MSNVEIIILIVAAVAIIVIVGWRAPERTPVGRDEELD